MLARTPQFSLLRRRRSGSVLILVIALLVLLALMGTAFISTSRNERGTAVQNVSNTEADLLLASMKAAVESTVAGDRFGFAIGGSAFAPASPLFTPSNNTFANWDSGETKTWLADRTPEQRNLTIGYAGDSLVGWKAISFPVIGSSGTAFESPYPSTTPGFLARYQTQSPWNSATSYLIGQTVSYTGTVTGFSTTQYTRNYVCLTANTGVAPPTSTVDWAPVGATNGDPKGNLRFEPATLTYNGQTLPAMNLLSGNAVTGYTGIGTIAAADADGDGIADSGLFKLPTGPMSDGVTYYGAVRIIDNNAAVNVNTAGSLISDYDAGGAKLAPAAVASGFNPSLFTTNIGLQELCSPTPFGTQPNNLIEMNSINSYRINIAYTAPPTVVSNPDLGPPTTPALEDDNNALRNDFTFFSQGDSLYHQLARRQDNPAYRQVLVGTAPQFQAFPLNDSVALASQFCINNSIASAPVLGTYLYHSLNGLTSSVPPLTDSVAPTSAYSPTAVNNWFSDNFNYGTAPYAVANSSGVFGPFYRPLRSQLTTVGSVNNSAPAQSGSLVTAQTTASQDMLPYTAPVWSNTHRLRRRRVGAIHVRCRHRQAREPTEDVLLSDCRHRPSTRCSACILVERTLDCGP